MHDAVILVSLAAGHKLSDSKMGTFLPASMVSTCSNLSYTYATILVQPTMPKHSAGGRLAKRNRSAMLVRGPWLLQASQCIAVFKDLQSFVQK